MGLNLAGVPIQDINNLNKYTEFPTINDEPKFNDIKGDYDDEDNSNVSQSSSSLFLPEESTRIALSEEELEEIEHLVNEKKYHEGYKKDYKYGEYTQEPQTKPLSISQLEEEIRLKEEELNNLKTKLKTERYKEWVEPILNEILNMEENDIVVIMNQNRRTIIDTYSLKETDKGFNNYINKDGNSILKEIDDLDE